VRHDYIYKTTVKKPDFVSKNAEKTAAKAGRVSVKQKINAGSLCNILIREALIQPLQMPIPS
jgi:hypothetical protein